MWDEILEGAVSAARAGGRVLDRYFRDASLTTEYKGQNDLVSEADRESERVILSILRERFPDHEILSEEIGRVGDASAEFEWIVDPLDGTSNFLAGLPIFAISAACRFQGELVVGVVFDPSRDELFTAVRGEGAFCNGRRLRMPEREGITGAFVATGYPFRARSAVDAYLAVFREVFLEVRSIRRCGAAALDLAYTAAGIYDGFFEFRLSAWDVAAGALLIREAGGVVTDLDGGEEWLRSGNVLAGSAAVHADLRRLVARHANEARVEALDPRPTAAAT